MAKVKVQHTQVPHDLGKGSDQILRPLDREVYLEMRNCLVDYKSMTVSISVADIARKLGKHRNTIQSSINKLIKMNEIEHINKDDRKKGKSPVFKFIQTKLFEMYSQDFVENRKLPERGTYMALQEVGHKVGNYLVLTQPIEEIAKQINVSERGLYKTFALWESLELMTKEKLGNSIIRKIEFDKIGQAFLKQVIQNTSDIEMIKEILRDNGLMK